MTTFAGQVSQSSDDATENLSGTCVLNAATLVANLTYWGFRWATTIPGAVTVSAAKVSLWATSTATMDRTLDFQNSNNPSTFTTAAHNLSTRTLTGSAVTWNASVTSGQFNDSPDLTTPAQAVINLSGFSSSPMACICVNQVTGPAVEAFDGNAAEAPKISVTYTAASATKFKKSNSSLGTKVGSRQAAAT